MVSGRQKISGTTALSLTCGLGADLHAQGKLEEVIAFFREKGYLYEEEGALWFRSTALGMTRPVLIKSDGLYTYVTLILLITMIS